MASSSRTLNVRLSQHSHAVLRHLAEEERESMQSLLDKAIKQYRREKFLRGANADYAELRKDDAAWNRELREREIWDRALADGLDEKKPRNENP